MSTALDAPLLEPGTEHSDGVAAPAKKRRYGVLILVGVVAAVCLIVGLSVGLTLAPGGSQAGVDIATRAVTPEGIKGYLDSFTNTYDGLVVKGWTCDHTVARSTSVHFYRVNSAGTRTFISSAPANLEPARTPVSTACATTGIGHTFSYTVSRTELFTGHAERLIGFGISLTGGSNKQLVGETVLPAPLPPRGVIGAVSSTISNSVTGANITGWACHHTKSASIYVHVYREDATGTRTYLGNTRANLNPRADRSAECHTTGLGHEFVYTVPRATLATISGQKIVVFGIAADDSSPNAQLTNSGAYTFPGPLYMLSERYAAGADLTIAVRERVVIDRSFSGASAALRVVTVYGRLECPRNTNSFTIGARAIIVSGSGASFECGTAAAPFMGSLEVEMYTGTNTSYGEAPIAAVSGGTLMLHGNGVGGEWVRLAAHAAAGATNIIVSKSVNWRVGDRIVVGPTRFNYLEAESLFIGAIAGNNITLTTPLRYPHYGQTQSYSRTGTSPRTWVMESRAEVGNLQRNIRFRTVGAVNSVGAHMMVMVGSRAYVDGVAFIQMGQLGRMGRYSFHWHRVGDATGQYIRNSAIVDPFQRCITVHATSFATVERNTCFNHTGHGYFFEDGNEVGNVMRSNLGMLSKRVPLDKLLLQSDGLTPSLQRQRFDAPATYWVSNPDNTIEDNVASGSQGSGFWMSFNSFLYCNSSSCTVVAADAANVFPRFQPTRAFHRNIAHATNVGFTWDGAPDGAPVGNPLNPNDRALVSSHYAWEGYNNVPGVMPVFNGLQALKCVFSGIYYRGSPSEFRYLVAGDNGLNLFIAFNQRFIDSLIVGESSNWSAEDRLLHKQRNNWTDKRLRGMVTYDGPQHLTRVHFAGYPSTNFSVDGVDYTPVPITIFGGATHYEARVENITWANPSSNWFSDFRSTTTTTGWLDALTHVRIRDVSGSMYGRANQIIVARHPFNYDTGCLEKTRTIKDNVYVCPYTLGVFHFGSSNMLGGITANTVDFQASRYEGTTLKGQTQWFFGSGYTLNGQMGGIVGNKYTYRVNFNATQVIHPAYSFHTNQPRQVSPIFTFLGRNQCTVVGGAVQVSSLAAVQSATTPVWFRDAVGTHTRVVTSSTMERDSLAYRSITVKLMC